MIDEPDVEHAPRRVIAPGHRAGPPRWATVGTGEPDLRAEPVSRRSRRPRTSAPLPIRDGLAPIRVRLPDRPTAPGETVADHLLERFPKLAGTPDGGRGVEPTPLARRMAAGDVVAHDGTVISPRHPYKPGLTVFFHRELAPEQVPDVELPVLLRDEHLLVVDKPHGIATTPRGAHVLGSALVRLRRAFELPELSPVHRLDRATAGVLAFSLRPRDRGAYQTLFARGGVRKTYLAVAPVRASLEFPWEVSLHMRKVRGVLQARVEDGEPNSRTVIELADRRGDRGLYRLTPLTGRTHQLRLHLSSLGIPIIGDDLYPVVREPAAGADGTGVERPPLQLLAQRLEFTDPVTGESRDLRSRRTLATWAAGTWAEGLVTGAGTASAPCTSGE